MKSGSLNLLEPSGPLQACNGFALSFTLVECLFVETVAGDKYNVQFYDTLAAILYIVRVACSWTHTGYGTHTHVYTDTLC